MIKLKWAAVFLCITTLSLTAQQQVPNGGFEDWHASGQGEDPDGEWISPNVVSGSISNFPLLVSKTEDAYSGNFALRVTSDTATLPPPAGRNTLDTLAGIVALNFKLASGEAEGVLFTDRPDSIVAYMKATVAPGDVCVIGTALRRNENQDVVGSVDIEVTNSIAEYRRISMPISYISDDDPERLIIAIVAGDIDNPMPGNELLVDDLQFIYNSSSVEEEVEVTEHLAIRTFPNPSQGTISIAQEGDGNRVMTIQIVDVLGVVHVETTLSGAVPVEDIRLESGLYMVVATDEAGNVVDVNKVLVE